ncbi:Shikimate dehydrogenase (NADP(+)) [Usitatibacter rugosus]|uniref:Shikimate dehydrogenase (NADP(+)) n=1 Tax=Usitatibacter rugosus TaxID=2732067 RepID=A0A6M4H3G3_9PROT|nr:shikimate dehydrogenase [Usitatibacter rugosus]QJR13084.1 Shikimate dehydrogenase (NADP(+)) [Usitatibacter rugosus]
MMATPPRFVVIGNPVGHSLSPAIHAQFAMETGTALEYATLLAPMEDFAGSASAFFEGGGRGANVTLPFKIEALRFAASATDRARLAGAANVLTSTGGRIAADNTDGAGLIADLTRNLGVSLAGARIALLGAGGAARGVIAPLLESRPAALVIANRTLDRAEALAKEFASLGPIEARTLAGVADGSFDVLINATSTSTKGTPLALAPGCLARGALAYDMAYGPAAKPFVEHARALGARGSDGLGMLVEQAAEAFLVWHGTRPATAAVLATMRARP